MARRTLPYDTLGANGLLDTASPTGEDIAQNSEYQLLFQPDKGKFINKTTFITSTNAVKDMRVKVISEWH
ncbi:MAG: protein phosphatase 2C domain-containing protein [Nostoc sp.]|uniref:protein phosphatase 2C domain-containing protein n=1 Tax=Nostoc sp. TaxID=1180 RepID=UPI002FFBA44A